MTEFNVAQTAGGYNVTLLPQRESSTPTAALARPRYRVKLVLPTVHDTQMFYLHTRQEADQAIHTLEQNVLPEAPGASVYLYVETTLGHVRIK